MAETEYQHVPRTESEMLKLLNDLTTPLEGNVHRDIVGSLFELILRSMVDAGYTDVQVEMAKGRFKDLASRLDAGDTDLRNISVNWINWNFGKIGLANVDEPLLQAIAGNAPVNAIPPDGGVTSPKIANKAVTPIKLSDYERPKNLLKSKEVTWVAGLLTSLGSVDAAVTTYQTSNMIEVDASKTHVTFSSLSNGVVNFYGTAGAFIEYNLVTSAYKQPDGSYVAPFSIPANAKSMRVSVTPGVWYQVEFGATKSDYSDESRYTLSGLNTGASESYVDTQVDQAKSDILSTINDIKPFNHDAEIVMFTAYGQSWAQGYDEDAYSTEQIYDNLMFNIGITNQPLEDEFVPTSFVPLIEQDGTHFWPELGVSQKIGETPVMGQTNMVKQLLKEENLATTDNVKYQLLGNSPGRGSSSIDELSKGTKWYNRLIAQVQQAYDLAQVQGKTFKMLAFSWTQGSGGEKLEILRSDIEADVKAITGQAEPVKCITWQNFPTANNQSASMYEQFVKLSEDYEHIVTACPAYHLKTLSKDNLHFEAQSTIKLGAYYGHVFKRVINDGVDFQPLKPVKVTVQGKIALLEFNNKTPLKFDTSLVTLADKYGFKVKNEAGVEQATSSVSLSSFNTVKIVKSTNFVGTDRIVYGDTGAGWGGADGKRGNLRDSAKEVYKYKNLTLPLHNWCVVFDKSINDLM